jgi:hypothetical protein
MADGTEQPAASLEERVAALEAAIALFTRKLFDRGDITINDARAAMGLPGLGEVGAVTIKPGIYTPEEAEAAMRAAGQFAADDYAAIKERVAALEECILFPLRMYVPKWEPLTEAQEAEFKESIAKVAKEMPLRVTLEPRPLSLGDIHCILRECVTVVKPGETLVIRDRNWTPSQMREIQQWMDADRESGRISFKVLVVPGDELGVVEARP